MECNQCGVCCRLFLINLTEEEYKSGRYKTLFDEFGMIDDFNEAELTGANILVHKNDESCIYLKASKCSVHKNRPQSCRNFFCKSRDKRFKSMIGKIKDYKKKNNQ